MSEQPPAGADNYKLGDEIARGGMGSVLQAEDAKLKRTVALKAMLMDADSDPGSRQRFIREAEVLAMLSHPNIVPIYDLVWEDNVPLFYTMKLVRGRTLQAIINDLRTQNAETLREFTLDRLLGIFRNVCNAVAFAHSKGVLHRDLKPENVMVGEFGEVLVMDWGLAKIVGIPGDAMADQLSSLIHPQSAAMTMQGAVLGTPQYMSPEQALGSIDGLDERSDIFSLGGILYAILTLRPPVEGKTLNEVLAKVSTGQIAAPSGLHAGPTQKGAPLPAGKIKPLPHIAGGRVPASLSAVAMKALTLALGAQQPNWEIHSVKLKILPEK
jgi:eukaryotic-like serine/threonine-protein kinase